MPYEPNGFKVAYTVKEYRRARFKELLATHFHGDRAAMIRATGLTKGRVSQLLNPAEPFGENAALHLVERLGLPADYFGLPASGGLPHLSKEALLLALKYDHMTPPERELLIRLVDAAIGTESKLTA